MDKNFVNIDDLVRQRLGGGEEQERSGAWLRMQDLLDKEMPRDKFVGMLYWRRFLSAMAVLLLVGTITVGGYELSAYKKANSGNTDAIAAVAAPSTTAPVTGNEVNNTSLSTPANTDNANDPKNEPSDKETSKPHHKLLAASHIAKLTGAVNENKHDNNTDKQIHASANTTSNSKTAIGNTVIGSASNNEVAAKETAAVNKEANQPAKEEKVADVVSENKVAEPKAAGKKEIGMKAAKAVAAKGAQSEKAIAAADAPVKVPAAKAAVKTPAANDNNKAEQVAVKKVSEKPAHHDAVAANNTPAHKSAKHEAKTADVKKDAVAKVSGEVAAKESKQGVAKQSATKVKRESIAKLPLGSKAPSAAGKVNEPTGHDVAARVNDLPAAGKLPLGAHAPAAKTVNNTGVAKVADLNKIAAKNNKAVTEKNVPGVVAANKAAVTAANNSVPGVGVKGTGVKPVAGKTAMNVPARKPVTGKKVVQKLVLLERYVKLSPNEGYYHIDTISMESLTEELGPENEDKPYFPRGAKKAGIAGVETTDNTANADGQILPGASASANGKPAMGTKEAGAKKAGGGSSVLENLTAAFNDIKYKASGVKFIPGLAAGVNGTFFAPTSFKGFQFGFTGNFVFGDEWSLATGLGYFHRINGSYSMYDNYYNYTAIPASQGGGYNKQEIDNSYSFSTLHSIEMPLAAKYTNGNFSFFAGANLVYNFAINTGRYTPPVSNNPVYSPIMANDAAPKLEAGDFNSRFGVGCLFGVSYQVTQKVSFDVRDVQTLWDNANTSGAKYISNQLYKNPSLQISIGYRLGKPKK